MRRIAKRDANHTRIVRALRDAGVSVHETHQLGGGFPDLVAGYRGRTTLLEVKTDRGTLTTDERDWHAAWRGQVAIVRTVDEALAAVGVEVERGRVAETELLLEARQ